MCGRAALVHNSRSRSTIAHYPEIERPIASAKADAAYDTGDVYEALERAVDEDGDVIDIIVQSRRNRWAAARFFRKLLKGQGREPRRLITDKLGSYAAAHCTAMPSVVHSTRQYENNRALRSPSATRMVRLHLRRPA